MPRTKQNDTATVDLPELGKEGDTCEQCGSVLAPDQRYCLNCGLRRGEARVDYEQRLAANGAQPSPNGAVAPSPASAQWSPIMAIGAIAVLGIMLLLGVLIGKKDNKTTQTVAAAAPTTTAAAAAAPTPTTDTTAAAQPAQGAAATAPGQGNVDKGGSGTTNGIQAAQTGKSTQDIAKNGPSQVATGGNHAALDPNGQAGGGSSATCIGC